MGAGLWLVFVNLSGHRYFSYQLTVISIFWEEKRRKACIFKDGAAVFGITIRRSIRKW
ncbi:MAG: hypothetical protein F6K48_21620 [Okeania sp. SIO3H1]|nr:hypothetical protein [Okeania sp. SIO3H1]